MKTSARFLLFGLLLSLTAMSSAQDEVKKKKPTRRFGYDVDEFTYPQQTPKDAMKSIARSLDRNKVDYLLAHMVDPKYVDYWVDRYQATFPMGKEEAKRLLAFDRLVRETNQYYQDDPLIVRELRAFAKEADWTENEDLAVGEVKSLPARKIFLRRIDDRWFLQNRQTEPPTPK